MTQLNMLSYKLQDMQFFNKLDKPGQVQLENNFSYSVDYNKENTRCVAKLYQCVKDKCDDENHKFFVSVELIGVFEIVGPVTDEDKKEIHVRTYQQVLPMLRCWSSRCAPPAACRISCCCATRWTRTMWPSTGKNETSAGPSGSGACICFQLFSSNVAPQERQWTVMRPFPRGTRICWPQLGHLK